MNNERPNPEAILSRLKQEEQEQKRGRLKVFFGAMAGVGKTYSMLLAARMLKSEGVDVVLAYVETHGRKETEALLEGMEMIPLKETEYQGRIVKELDLDAVLKRKPQLALVDELAHTNAPGSRHTKRWQDVSELLAAGIDVFTTVNVQHLESLRDVVAQITRISVRERVPDSLLEEAQEIELIDLPPEELIERLKAGKVYVSQQAKSAMDNFFRKGNIIALRELALRYTADRVDADMERYRKAHEIKHPWPAAEHLLVCVSPSPLSSRLVRAGKRMAEALRARWLVVYVEGGRQTSLSDEDRTRLAQTLRLAELLGAETLELSGNNVPEEIIKCANQYNVSKIIIGKPANPRWKELLFGSIVDEVIRQSGAIDVYVITSKENDGTLPVTIGKLNASSKKEKYLLALLIVCACTGLARMMLPYFELSNVVMSYLIGVVLVASSFGRGPSIFASILSVATFDFFCVPPFYTFAVADTQYVVTFAVMLMVALTISTLTVTIKAQAESARLREMRTAALYSMSRELSSNLDLDNLASIGVEHIGSVFRSKTALYLLNKDGQPFLAAKGQGHHELQDVESGIVSWVHQNKQMAGLGTETLPGTQALYLPLLAAKKNIGVLVLKPEEPGRFKSPEQIRLLETFSNQLALACARASLSEEHEQARMQVKIEQLKNALLSSVSHDLRTPLSTISGAASSILEGTKSLDQLSCFQLVKEIYDESLRMNRLVGNLLDMTRLQAGLELVCQLQPADELVGAAVSYMEDKLNGNAIKTRVPLDLPLIYADETLMQQVLVNLIENASKYAEPGSEIEIAAELVGEDKVQFSISDRGPGIEDKHKQLVFEKFYRGEPAKTIAGAGLGLSICNGIIEAHGGKIWVEDRPGGGAIFKFTLPCLNSEVDFAEDDYAEE